MIKKAFYFLSSAVAALAVLFFSFFQDPVIPDEYKECTTYCKIETSENCIVECKEAYDVKKDCVQKAVTLYNETFMACDDIWEKDEYNTCVEEALDTLTETSNLCHEHVKKYR